MLLKLKKENTKNSLFFSLFLLLLFSGAAPPGGNISILGATCSHPPEGDWSPLLLFGGNAGAILVALGGDVDGHITFLTFTIWGCSAVLLMDD